MEHPDKTTGLQVLQALGIGPTDYLDSTRRATVGGVSYIVYQGFPDLQNEWQPDGQHVVMFEPGPDSNDGVTVYTSSGSGSGSASVWDNLAAALQRIWNSIKAALPDLSGFSFVKLGWILLGLAVVLIIVWRGTPALIQKA